MSRLKPAAPFTSTQTRLRLASMEQLARLVDKTAKPASLIILFIVHIPFVEKPIFF